MSVDKQKLVSLINETQLESAEGGGQPGYVYFIVCVDAPKCKIGFTKGSIENRLRTLQTGCPNELAIICAHPGTIDTERRLHERFSDSHIRGEWFRITDELRAYIVVSVWAVLGSSLRGGWAPPQWSIDASEVILNSLGTMPESLAEALEASVLN